jgi:hypothetical protein
MLTYGKFGQRVAWGYHFNGSSFNKVCKHETPLGFENLALMIY